MGISHDAGDLTIDQSDQKAPPEVGSPPTREIATAHNAGGPLLEQSDQTGQSEEDSPFALELSDNERVISFDVGDPALPQNDQKAPPEEDSSLAWELSDKELAIARDAAFAQSIALAQLGLVASPSAPSAPDASSSFSAPSLCTASTSGTPGASSSESPLPTCGTGALSLRKTAPPIKCPICFELTPSFSCFPPAECEHAFCMTCIRQYLVVIAMETHQYPFPCPQCQGTEKKPAFLDPQTCVQALAGTGEPLFALQRLLLERQHVERLCYCSNKACSEAFDFKGIPGVEGEVHENQSRISCPVCGTDTCVECRVEWHEGGTCAEYQEEQSSDYSDSLLVQLAEKNRWKTCPNCNALVERQKGDCNFVKCRFGCGFCHNCGLAYAALEKMANNEHGSPTCSCGLFNYSHFRL